MTELTHGLEDNRFEQAYPEDVEALEEVLNEALAAWKAGARSRPGLADEIYQIVSEFKEYAKNTEQVMQ